MSDSRTRFRNSEWLTALLLLPLLAGITYLLTLGTMRPLLANSAAGTPTPRSLPVAETGTGSRWQKIVSATAVPDPAPDPLVAFRTWLNNEPASITGVSRARPHPPAALVALENWQLQRLDQPIIRGEEAWQLLQQASGLNEPPAAGYEYVLVPLSIKHRRLTIGEKNLAIHLTGEDNIVYFSSNASVVAPEPRLVTSLPAHGESQGWKAFQVRTGEQKLQLVVEDTTNDGEPARYLALTTDAALTVPHTLLSTIIPTASGRHPAEPARVGQTVTTENWQITVGEAAAGEAAWLQIQAANQFNDSPPAGREYRLLRVQMRYIGREEGPVTANRYLFHVIGDDGSEYEWPAQVPPQPELFYELFPGGEADGWVIAEVATADETPLLVFRPRSSGGERDVINDRYFSIGTP